MYGSLQFESVLRADKAAKDEFGCDISPEQQIERYSNFINGRLGYFDKIVSDLLKH